MHDTNDRSTTTKCTEWQYSDDVGHTIVAEVISTIQFVMCEEFYGLKKLIDR